MNISVALATHNGSTHLKEQIESLVKQTLPPMEIIISDDGSTDGTCELLSQYSHNHATIRIIYSEKQGINANFQNALSACNGDYIALCDQDDIWKTDKLEKLAAHCTEKTLLLYGKSILIDDKGNKLPIAAERYLGFNTCRSGHIPLYFIFSNCVSGHAMMISKRLVDCALPFVDDCIYDHWLALIAASKADIVYVADAITYHRIHDNNATNNREKNRTKKQNTIKPSKVKRYHMQQTAFVLRLKKALSEGSGLSPVERNYLTCLLNHISRNEHRFFNFRLAFLLLQKRNQLFHGNPLRECRNRALGRKYYRLLDSLSKRQEAN